MRVCVFVRVCACYGGGFRVCVRMHCIWSDMKLACCTVSMFIALQPSMVLLQALTRSVPCNDCQYIKHFRGDQWDSYNAALDLLQWFGVVLRTAYTTALTGYQDQTCCTIVR